MSSTPNHSQFRNREWDEIEPPITAFESAWKRGERPSIADYIPAGSPRRRLLLVELIHADLEFRIKARERARVEDYLRAYPELAGDREVVFGLIRSEWAIRVRGETNLAIDHFLERFPDFEAELLATSPNAPTRSEIRPPAPGALSTADFIALPLPKRLGKYELRQKVGLGGFGFVFRAWDTVLFREVAIKIPRPEVSASPTDVLTFLREARNAIDLRHPNIVAIHDAGPIDGTVCLVSEFIEGVTLAERIGVGPLGVGESASLMLTVVNALGHAHRKGIIHRDLKPSNILLDRDGVPHLTDFGLAKRSSGDSTLSPVGASRVLIGTPAYMPPEQARGDSSSVDARSDVYSAGVLLYELLTGSVPFRGRGRLLQIQIEDAEPPPPRELNDEIPLDLETICLRALAKHPSDRYPSASAMAHDLANFVDGRPVGPRPIAARPPSRWRERRKVIGWGIFGAAILVVLTGLALRSGSLERQAARDSRLIERLIRDSTDVASLPFPSGAEPGDEHRRMADAIWDRSRTWIEALADRPGLAAFRADLSIQLARHAESVGSDPETRAAWEAAVAALEPPALARSSPWSRRAELAEGLAALGELENNAGRKAEARGRFEQSASVWNKLAKFHRDRLEASSGRVSTQLHLAEAILEGDRAARNADQACATPASAKANAPDPADITIGEAEQIANDLRDHRDLACDELSRLIEVELGLARRHQSIKQLALAAFWGHRAIRSAERDTGGNPTPLDLAIERSRAMLLVGLVEADATDFGFEGRAVELLQSSAAGFAEAIALDPTNFTLRRDRASAELGLASIFARSGSDDRAIRSFREALASNQALRRIRPNAHDDLDRSAAIRSGLAQVQAHQCRPWSAIALMAAAVAQEHRAVRLAPGKTAYRQARRVYVENLFRLMTGQPPTAATRSE